MVDTSAVCIFPWGAGDVFADPGRDIREDGKQRDGDDHGVLGTEAARGEHGCADEVGVAGVLAAGDGVHLHDDYAVVHLGAVLLLHPSAADECQPEGEVGI